MENPATTNQPRDPLATVPMPGGINTNTSSTIVTANPVNARLRITCTGTRIAT